MIIVVVATSLTCAQAFGKTTEDIVGTSAALYLARMQILSRLWVGSKTLVSYHFIAPLHRAC